MHPRAVVSSLAVAAWLVVATASPAQARGTVAVFVLAGQSNMEGKVQNGLLEHQARDPATAELFAHLRDGDAWRVREDVFVDFLGRRGGLTVGFGSPGRTGVELEFGHVVGERLDEPVLLVKTARGGHSLFRDFRPPSAGLPSDDSLAAELAATQRRVRERNAKQDRQDPLPTMADVRGAYGQSYRNLLAEVRSAIEHCGERFPSLRDRTPRIAGLVWFQGWNDQYGGAEKEYETNLRHLIADLRRDLATPELPVVVGVMGQNGSEEPKGAMKVVQDAQEAVADMAFVRAVRTDVLVDRRAEELYPRWQERTDEWNRVGSDHKYHYLGSAIWHLRMGRAFGEAMLELLEPAPAGRRDRR